MSESRALDPEVAAKADASLLRALEEAAPEGELRVILTLRKKATPGGEGDEGGGAAPPAPPDPKDFPDRVAYRQAMIEHHGQHPLHRVATAREALEALGLVLQGGGPSGLMVACGPAAAMARALALDSVERGTLDRHVDHQGALLGPPGEW